MKVAAQGSASRANARAYTLIELLCSVGIVLLLAAMLLPAFQNGYAKAQRLYCVNNLRQSGLAFHGFAHSHQDRFPMQVPINEGGSLEYLQAANTITGQFYFSYRHFLPLSNDLVVPKVLGCPTDTRHPATNFATLQNANLSYFVAGSPEFGSATSVLAGNRNVGPAFGSIARVGGYRRLQWTEELHRFKGNVLFADAHVEQLDDMFSITNSAVRGVASLHMPSVPPPPEAPPASEVGYFSGGGLGTGSRGAPPTVCAVTNLVGTNLVVTWQTGGGRRGGALLVLPPVAAAGSAGATPAPVATRPSPPLGAPIASTATPVKAPPPDWSAKGIYHRAAAQGKELARAAALVAYDIPWYLLLLLIAALLELRRRIRARRRRFAATA